MRRVLAAARTRFGVRFARLPLFWKLLAPGLVVVFVLAVVVLFVTVRLSAQQDDRALENDLERESLAAALALRDAEFQAVQAARATSLIEGLSEAMHSADSGALSELLVGAYVVRFRLDLLVATDSTGTALEQFSGPAATPKEARGESWAGHAPVAGAISAGGVETVEISSGVVTTDEGAMFLAVAPVHHSGEVHSEFVVAGLSMDRVLNAAAPSRDTVFALYDPDGDLLSASSDAAADHLDGPVTRPARLASSLGGRAYATRVDPVAREGEAIGALAVSIPRTSAGSFARTTGLRLLLIVVLGIAGLALLYALIARTAVRQIRDLRDVARRLGHGELSARAQAGGTDELSELAVGVNHMAEELEAVQHEVERRVALQTAELRRLHSRSEKAFERQADALALISHEFRNPIFAILGHAELMTDGRFRDDDTGWAQEWGATIKGAAEELLRHVNDILEFSRSQASRERLALEAVDVVAQVSSLRPTFEALARRGELVLTVDAAPRVPEVRANADAVRDVALNLVSNAVKYTPPGGAVRITVRPDGDRVLLAVSDTGVGIPSAERRQIFEPFYRVEGVRAMHGQLSTGLGLALTQQLVKAMGGAVAVESEVGAGSTFTVSLRKAQARSRVKGGPKSNGSNGSNGSPATSAAARTAQTSQT